jgi:methylated-DNA-[protein]-cysteine S-methyltransferase
LVIGHLSLVIYHLSLIIDQWLFVIRSRLSRSAGSHPSSGSKLKAERPTTIQYPASSIQHRIVNAKNNLLKRRFVENYVTYYHIFPTSFGYAAILFQKEPLLVKRIFLPHPHKGVVQRRIQTPGVAPAHSQRVFELCKKIQGYFKGQPISPPWGLLDMSQLTPLQRSVLEVVASVPHGAVQTYAQIARQIGRPKAYRFVGTTLARNPLPVVIPCHRIIRADGSLGGFFGGTELKKRMLALERM